MLIKRTLLLFIAASFPLQSATVERFLENPIIVPDMVPKDPVVNINGPSLIRAPTWLPHRLGKYYLYFANHRGPSIHLAYADNLHGPWRMAPNDPLSVFQVANVNQEMHDKKSHVASPDIFIDERNQKIRMYFHFRLPELGHLSSVAESSDGLTFSVQPGSIGKTYLRHFVHNDWYYVVDKQGHLSRSKDGLTDFEKGPNQIFHMAHDPISTSYLRHTGLYLKRQTLQIFFSRINDTPESILWSTMTLDDDWRQWQLTPPRMILQPETIYEGIDLPNEPSQKGDAKGRQHQVRDPFIFEDDGELYLLYSVAGEYGIAIAKITL